jgi:hypothetical protein
MESATTRKLTSGTPVKFVLGASVGERVGEGVMTTDALGEGAPEGVGVGNFKIGTAVVAEGEGAPEGV